MSFCVSSALSFLSRFIIVRFSYVLDAFHVGRSEPSSPVCEPRGDPLECGPFPAITFILFICVLFQVRRCGVFISFVSPFLLPREDPVGFAWGPAESCWFSLGRCCYEKRGGKPERGRRRRWGDAGIVPFFPELPGGVTSPRWLAGCSFQLLSLGRAFLFDSAWLLVVVTLGHRALGWALSPRADACAGHMSRNTLLFFLPAFPFFFFFSHRMLFRVP